MLNLFVFSLDTRSQEWNGLKNRKKFPNPSLFLMFYKFFSVICRYYMFQILYGLQRFNGLQIQRGRHLSPKICESIPWK